MFDMSPDALVEQRVQMYLWGREAEDRGLYVTLDRHRYEWAMQWRWGVRRSRDRGDPRHKVKWYASRSTTVAGRNVTVYLHKVICRMAHGRPPTPRHIISDHCNGNSLDCWDDNLRWATPKMNRENYNGFYALQLRFSFMDKSSSHQLLDSLERRRTPQKEPE